MFSLKKKLLVSYCDRRELDSQSKKAEEKQNVDPKAKAENITNSNEKETQKQLIGDKKEADEKNNKEKREQRVQSIPLLFI